MLLASPPSTDLPAEALLVRLRARRGALNLAGDSDAGLLPMELIAWLYPRLDRSLRAGISPWLEVEAMTLLLVALRYRLGGEAVPVDLLRRPWLAEELAALLDQPGEACQVVARVEQWLAQRCPFVAGLAAEYLRQGPGRVEQQLSAGILGWALARARAPVVCLALRFRVDVRNLLAILRHWRWQLRVPPGLLPGGELDSGVLARAWASGDHVTVRRLAARLSGAEPVDLDPRAVERQLLGGLSLRLRRAGRDPLGAGVVLDTLWRCRIVAGNRALRQGAGDEDGLLAVALL